MTSSCDEIPPLPTGLDYVLPLALLVVLLGLAVVWLLLERRDDEHDDE